MIKPRIKQKEDKEKKEEKRKIKNEERAERRKLQGRVSQLKSALVDKQLV
jgi:hypothetical protein